ncbi:hypothetical protein [Sinomonas terrae]|uniref:Uncharacterized protein n=1 Tax=Sinomonas terrae TaxID=2908838 RepID=A0ABS9U0E2_9MICC|nr:hypothetical protein [Sinomonas terrae]MCH6470120.1 hypothetical protein [Sinomonas terrae]HKU12260.1 hypothetical protein [Sinomonas sp.]
MPVPTSSRICSSTCSPSLRSAVRLPPLSSAARVTILTEPSAVVSLAPKAQEAAALIEKLL